MSVRWSHTKTAVNRGWGKIMPRSTPGHPEYTFKGPYGAYALPTGLPMYHHASPVGGARFKKGSKAAKQFMARLRAMRGRGYSTAALDGYGVGGAMDWNTANEIVSSIGKNLSSQTANAVAQIASKANMDMSELLNDPDKLLALAQKYAPTLKNAASKVMSWLTGKKQVDPAEAEREKRRAEIKEYMNTLKMYNPEQYREMYKRMRENAWKQYQAQHQALFDFGQTE